MMDKKSDVSRLLDRLIGKRLVAKNQCPNDKRASDISITEAGLTLLQFLDATINNMDAQLLNLTKEEALQLSKLLDKSRS
jgi:DNA-binding MarR family transcriptional regulator